MIGQLGSLFSLSFSQIAVGGAAAKDGRLKVGHRILEVNGISLLGASHLDAVKALRSSPDKISITVCQGFNPQEVLRRKSEGEALASSRAEKSTSGCIVIIAVTCI